MQDRKCGAGREDRSRAGRVFEAAIWFVRDCVLRDRRWKGE